MQGVAKPCSVHRVILQQICHSKLLNCLIIYRIKARVYMLPFGHLKCHFIRGTKAWQLNVFSPFPAHGLALLCFGGEERFGCFMLVKLTVNRELEILSVSRIMSNGKRSSVACRAWCLLSIFYSHRKCCNITGGTS